jgi:hypothetical protein
MSRLHEQAEQIKEASGGVWGEHQDHTVNDWRYEVTNDDTRLGYWEWVANKIELEKELTK